MKRGFTLIELLAVIVILAIIALIAVPVVVNIIKDSKKSSDEQSVELYIDSVKKAIARKQLEESNFNPNTCNIQDNGNLLCGNEEIIIDIKGIRPSKGVIVISNNKIYYNGLLFNEKYYNNVITLIEDKEEKGLSVSDKYTYKVNDTDTFNFYVLSFNEEDNTANLIMDRNICNDGTINYTSDNNYCRHKWNRRNTDGPEEIMNYLYLGTKDWDNVPNMNFTYDDTINNDGNNGYREIVIANGIGKIKKKNNTEIMLNLVNNKPIKARLSTNAEMNNIGCTSDSESCPIWIMGNLTYINNKYLINKNNGISTIFGYWLLSSNSTFDDRGQFIDYRGRISNTTSGISNQFGARPVITVPKDYLEN